MKKICSIFICLTIVFCFTSVMFASENSSRENIIVITLDDSCESESVFEPIRGTTFPTETVSLYDGVSYTGTACYSVCVYTNYMFSNHGGSIAIDIANNSYSPLSSDYMELTICHRGILGAYYDQTVRLSVNCNQTVIFNNLNTNKSYFFYFHQPSQNYETETSFVITRGN